MHSTVTRAAPVAFGFALIGFGVMNAWWLAAPHTELPGLYDYASATWGDGLLLPLAIAALWTMVMPTRTSVVLASRVLPSVLGGIGVLAGGVMQTVWLLDPAPRLNWTLTAAHHFTAAGWYHAGFLAITSGLFLSGTGLLIIRIRQGYVPAPGPVVVLVLTMTGFATLVVRDGFTEAATVAQLATWVTLAIGALVAAMLVRGRFLLVLRWVPAVAVWVSVIFVAPDLASDFRLFVFLLVSAGICVALVLGRPGRGVTFATVVELLTSAVVCTVWMAWSAQHWPGNLLAAMVTPATAMVAYSVMSISAFRSKPRWVDVLLVGVHLLLVADVGVYLANVGTGLDPLLFTTVLAIASFLQVTVTRQLTKERFQRLVHAEDAQDEGKQVDVQKVVTEVWTWALGTYVAALCAVLMLTIGAVISKGFQPGGTSERLSLLSLLGGGLVACVAASVTAILAKRGTSSAAILLPALLGVIGWIALLLSAQPFPHRFYYMPWACVAGLLMGIVTWESVLSNVSRLNTIAKPSKTTHVTAIALGLFTAVNAYWLLAGVASGPGTAESVPRALAALFTVIVVQLVIVVCVGVAAQTRLPQLKTRYATWFNLFQDNILFTALVVVFGFVPLFLFRHLEPLSLRRTWESIFALGPVLTFVGGLLMMSLGLNYDHLRRMAKQAKRPQYDGMPIAALKRHITLQNRLGVLLAATTFVGLANGLQDVRDLRMVLFLWHPDDWNRW